jgi:hypothetical protein
MQERQAIPEPFASAEVAAEFLGIKRRLLLAMARIGMKGAYRVGTGKIRGVWVFRISELTSTVVSKTFSCGGDHGE